MVWKNRMETNWTLENLEITAYLISHMNFRLTKKIYTRPFTDFFTKFITWFLIVVRQEVSKLHTVELQ